MSSDSPLPVTLLSGFLGSGKTTLLKRLVEQREGLKLAVIVNDMSELNIDSELIKNSEFKLKHVEEKMVEMANGCICCTLREDLILEVIELVKEKRFDYLVIESTGISEPMAVAEAWSFDLEEDKYHLSKLSKISRLDTLVTVIDTAQFKHYISSKEQLSELFENTNVEDDKSVAHLLVDQIECANIILLNKMDSTPPEEAAMVEGLVRQLNKDAIIIKTSYSEVPFKSIINTGLYSEEHASKLRGWMDDLKEEKKPETIEYGISSLSYRRRRPFHPSRLEEFVNKYFREFSTALVRSKGYVWIANRNNFMVEWASAGSMMNLSIAGQWIVCSDQALFPSLPDEQAAYFKKYDSHPLVGDRRQELVLIGIHLQKAGLEQELDQCLLTEEEFNLGPAEWAKWTDAMEVSEGEEHHTHEGESNTFQAATQLMQEGDYKTARRLLKELTSLVEYNLACCDGVEGKVQSAVKHLTLAVDNGFANPNYLTNDKDLSKCKSHKAFPALVQKARQNQSNKSGHDEDDSEEEEESPAPVKRRTAKKK